MLPVPVPLKGSIGIEGSLSGPRSGGGDQQRCISVVFRRAAIPLLPAPSADLLGSPVSHIWEEGSLLRPRAPTCLELPTYGALSQFGFLCLGFATLYTIVHT